MNLYVIKINALLISRLFCKHKYVVFHEVDKTNYCLCNKCGKAIETFKN